MTKPKNSFRFYFILALFFSTLIFASGLSIGLLVDSFKENFLMSGINDLKASIQNTEIEMLLMDYLEKNMTCSYLNYKSFNLMRQANDLGSQVNDYEKANSQRTTDYVALKTDYMGLLVKNWIVLEKIKRECNSNYSIILYFYKTKDECLDCSNQGIILTHLKDKYDKDLMIFAIDSSLNAGFISLIEQSFNVTKYPSITIDNELMPGFRTMEEIEALI